MDPCACMQVLKLWQDHYLNQSPDTLKIYPNFYADRRTSKQLLVMYAIYFNQSSGAEADLWELMQPFEDKGPLNSSVAHVPAPKYAQFLVREAGGSSNQCNSTICPQKVAYWIPTATSVAAGLIMVLFLHHTAYHDLLINQGIPSGPFLLWGFGVLKARILKSGIFFCRIPSMITSLQQWLPLTMMLKQRKLCLANMSMRP
jgi:hypothetical protein